MKNLIKSIFEFFGYTIVSTTNFEHTNWEVNHYKTAYENLEKSNTKFHKFVTNEIMAGWTRSDEHCKELIKQLGECIENWEKTIELNDRCIAYIHDINTNQANELKRESLEINKTIKENYSHQLADCGTAIDRLIGELMSAHNYTEQDIEECIGYKKDSQEHKISLYNQVKKFLNDYNWKYND